MSNEPRIITTRPMVGLCAMQVCVKEDVTDEEILTHCNTDNPSGTTNGWFKVLRNEEDCKELGLDPETCTQAPCAAHQDRTHLLVLC